MLAASWLHARIPVLPKKGTWEPWSQICGWEERAPQGVHNSSQPVRCSRSTNGFSTGIGCLLPLCWRLKLPWTPPASRMFLFRGLCKTDGENKKGKWKQEGTSVSSRAGWRVLCLSEEILVPMDCTRLAAEFLVFAVDAITCSSCCYHRNHKIHLKVYINNIVTWLWFWKLTPFNFAWFILYTLLWRYFHQ